MAADILEPLNAPRHSASTEEDLAETVRLVEKEDQRILASKTDVRDLGQLRDLAD